MKKNYFKICFSSIFIIAFIFSLNAQITDNRHELDASVWDGCVIVPTEFTEHVYIPRAKNVAYNMDNRVTPCSTFIVTYNGFSPEAQAAFQFAVDIWANLIDSSVPIRVNANYTPLNTGVLGSAGPSSFLINEPEFVAGTAYAAALGESIIGEDRDGPTGTSNDINCNFNSTRSDWYFGTDGNTPPNDIDFVSVVLHELGHGLGLLGFGRVDDNDTPTTGLLRNSGFIHAWDNFIDGTDIFLNPSPLTNEPDPSPELLGQYTNNRLTCNSAEAINQNGGTRPKMYAPASWDGGSSYSHWDEFTYPNSNPNALMTPFLSDGVAIHDPGPMTLGFMQDMGWTLCAGALSRTDFTIDDFSISPNPFSNKLSINISNTALVDDDINFVIYDINGRAVYSANPRIIGNTIELNSLENLSPSVYFLKISSGTNGFNVTKKIIKQ